MDLSCRENQVNHLLPVYLMPGQELNETPQGDVSEDFKSHHSRTRKLQDRLQRPAW